MKYEVTWQTVVDADDESEAIENSLLLLHNEPRFEPVKVEVIES